MDPMEFHGRMLTDPVKAREQLTDGNGTGEADFEVALFGVLDTGKPVGVQNRQVIDRGSFRGIIEGRDFEKVPAPYYLDHGHAPVYGFVDQRLKLGKADHFREEETALVFRGLFNLEKQIARETFSDTLFDPTNTPHSFRWKDEHTYRGDDGFEHVDRFEELIEVSHCGRAAQMGTGVRPDSISARTVEDLQRLVGDDPAFARFLTGLLATTVEYKPDGTQPSPKMRATSLNNVATAVRTAWYTSHGYSDDVDDVLVGDTSFRSGEIVCRLSDGRYVRYTWTKGDEGYTFSEEYQEVEAAWVSARAEMLKALLAAPNDLVAVLKDEKARGIVEQAIATAAGEQSVPDSEIQWLERMWFDRETV